ncbi:hypothetical protein ACMD2_16239 [Ananas comosus]|uniref:DUF8040 domain-containing protein n=1 Tax=Ananas comosus TaxID=4615 RepID=A0A199VS47_ANACO|nr:hypothetical protein ACMD2_16239 [Ananas comosus]
MYVQEVLEGHDERCKREFRMETHVFKALVKCLRDKGLISDTKYVSAEEQEEKRAAPLRPWQGATVAEKSAAPPRTAAATGDGAAAAAPPQAFGACVHWLRVLEAASEAGAMDGLDFFAAGAIDELDFFAAGIGSIAAKAAASAAVSAVAEVSAAEERVGCGEGGD